MIDTGADRVHHLCAVLLDCCTSSDAPSRLETERETLRKDSGGVWNPCVLVGAKYEREREREMPTHKEESEEPRKRKAARTLQRPALRG